MQTDVHFSVTCVASSVIILGCAVSSCCVGDFCVHLLDFACKKQRALTQRVTLILGLTVTVVSVHDFIMEFVIFEALLQYFLKEEITGPSEFSTHRVLAAQRGASHPPLQKFCLVFGVLNIFKGKGGTASEFFLLGRKRVPPNCLASRSS